MVTRNICVCVCIPICVYDNVFVCIHVYVCVVYLNVGVGVGVPPKFLPCPPCAPPPTVPFMFPYCTLSPTTPHPPVSLLAFSLFSFVPPLVCPLVACVVVGVVICNFKILPQGIVSESHNTMRDCLIKKITTDLKSPHRDLFVI